MGMPKGALFKSVLLQASRSRFRSFNCFLKLFAAVSLLTIPCSSARNAEPKSTYTRSSAAEARIEIDGTQRSPSPIPRTIYGTFLEDIRQSTFGGVSAELLDNPSLESYHASLRTLRDRFSAPEFDQSSQQGLPLPWLPLHSADGWRYEPRWGNAANSDSYLYVMGLQGREVGIRQGIYLPIHRVRDYQGVLFGQSSEGDVKIKVSFRKHGAPDEVLASTSLMVPGNGRWNKQPFRLSLGAGAVAPFELVDFAVSLEGDYRVGLDEIRLYPSGALEGLLDPDVIKAAASLHTPLLRFGGNFTSGYHWEDGVGPIDARRTMLNQSWGFPEYNEFGTDELMSFCRLIGARPQICLNLGSGTPEEARAWVQYCQGGPGTPQGQHRAANGHPEVYPVAAWELGNELWGHFQIGWQTPEGYAERYRKFYQAIRDVVPQNTMVFANGEDPDKFQAWNGALISKDASELNYFTTHFVVGMDDLKDHKQKPDGDTLWAADFAIPVGVGRALTPIRDQINANPSTRGRVRLAFTEWLFVASEKTEAPRFDNLGGALITAGWLNMLLQNADFVPVSDMTGLLEFGGISKRRGQVYLSPQCMAFSLYSNYAGDTLVAARVTTDEYDVGPLLRRLPAMPDVPYLDVVATTDSARHDLTLFVVNRDWTKARTVAIAITGFQASGQATVRTLSSGSILDRNDEEHPEAVHPVMSTLDVPAGKFHYEFPAHSLTVITFAHQ